MDSEIREDLGYGERPIVKIKPGYRDDEQAVYRVEMKEFDGSVVIKRVGKEWLRPNMKIIERIK
jgi:hypothetical protein